MPEQNGRDNDDWDFFAATVPLRHRRLGIARDYRIASQTANACRPLPRELTTESLLFLDRLQIFDQTIDPDLRAVLVSMCD